MQSVTILGPTPPQATDNDAWNCSNKQKEMIQNALASRLLLCPSKNKVLCRSPVGARIKALKSKNIEHLKELYPKAAVALLTILSALSVGAQTLQQLFSFSFTNGSHPAALTLGVDGNFYGTTQYGGSYGTNIFHDYGYGYGTVFKVTPSGTFTTLVNFDLTNGANPAAALTLGTDAIFYGTTTTGGSNGYGTVFKVTTNGTFTTLVDFNLTNGAGPATPLILGGDGNFYGTAGGGTSGQGLVFRMTTNGTLSTVVNFHVRAGYGYISSALALGSDDNFYGTAYSGGGEYGTVSEVTVNGTLTTLVHFNGFNDGPGDLTLGRDGNLYGTTYLGGSADGGTVFRVTTNGTVTTLADFDEMSGPGDLTLGSDGNFYGTTVAGGTADNGKVFQVTPNGELTILVNIDSEYWDDRSALTLGSDGNFYGTTLEGVGGVDGDGLIFAMLIPVIITVQPQSQISHAGSTAALLVNAVGPNPITDPLNYQWRKNGNTLINGGNVSGVTSNMLTITDISDSDAGNYSVIVSNSSGTVTSSNAMLAVDDLPFIAVQPFSQTVVAGSNATINVTVYGAPPFVFQWYHNDSPLGSPASGGNISFYTLTAAGTDQAGNYKVLVVDGYGSTMSSNALLTVIVPPSITAQPLGQRVLAGSSVSFDVSVSGTGPFSYQWLFNGANIPNATSATYGIQAVSTNDIGNYSVVVTSLAGTVTSSNALLMVIVPPSLALQLWAGYPVLELNGMLGNNFVVQYNTNLASTNWNNLLSLSNLSASPYMFLDPFGVAQPARFYRAFMR